METKDTKQFADSTDSDVYRFFGFDILQGRDLLITLIKNGVDQTYQADLFSLPPELPSLLDPMPVTEVIEEYGRYPLVRFESIESLDGRLAALDMWRRFQERIHAVSLYDVNIDADEGGGTGA